VVGESRFRRRVKLVTSLVSYRRADFGVAVVGATVFAFGTVASSWVLRWVIDNVIVERFESGSVDASATAAGIAVFVLVAIVRAAGVIVRRTWAGKAQWGIAEDLSGEAIDAVVRQPVPWHRRQSTGDLMTRVGVDVEAAVQVVAPLPFSTGVVLMLVIASGGLIAADPLLGVLATLVFPLIMSLNLVYQKRADRWYDLAQAELATLSSAAHESFEAVTVVKAFGAEAREASRLSDIAFRVRSARVQAIKVRSLFETLLDVVPNAASVLIVLLGSYRVSDGAMTVGDLASFIYIFALLVFPLRIIGYAFSEMPRSQAGFDRVKQLVAEPVESDPRSRLRLEPGDVVLTDVSVEQGDGREVLSDLTCRFPSGALTAVVGPTGSGKTTLLHALAGLLAPSRGSIAGPLADSALVFQEPFLMSGSIRENITLGRSMGDDVLRRALEIAQAHFVFDLPGGPDAPVGERGVGLSGGQRQRIALARAIAGSPRVLLLDDTTSALDPSTEAAVLDGLRRSLVDTTVIAVSSRPSLVANADWVIFIDGGRIVDRGRHEEIAGRTEAYSQLMSTYESDRS
jgi:ATP-binding cassette subfamily B protein